MFDWLLKHIYGYSFNRTIKILPGSCIFICVIKFVMILFLKLNMNVKYICKYKYSRTFSRKLFVKGRNLDYKMLALKKGCLHRLSNFFGPHTNTEYTSE